MIDTVKSVQIKKTYLFIIFIVRIVVPESKYQIRIQKQRDVENVSKNIIELMIKIVNSG